MKILQVITSLRIGGAEKLVIDMVPLFKQGGHEVDVFVFDGMKTSFLYQLEKNGIRVIRYKEGGSVYNPKNIFRLRKLIPHYDIVHAHNTACQYYVAIARNLCSCKKTRFITTEHSTNNRRRNLLPFKYLDRWMYYQYNSVVAISDKTSKRLHDFIGNNLNIEIIQNGIDLNLFSTSHVLAQDKILKRKEGSFIISMVAGFREEKDQDTVISSLKYLPENCILWLVGEGVRKNLCEKLVQSLDLSTRVIFAGVRTDVPDILKSSDVVVMSSHWEGFGLAAVEGMAVGKPVIASNVDGLAQVVGGAGLLFETSNAKALAVEIQSLLNDKKMYQEVATQCAKRASDFNIRKTVDKYLKLYMDICFKG